MTKAELHAMIDELDTRVADLEASEVETESEIQSLWLILTAVTFQTSELSHVSSGILGQFKTTPWGKHTLSTNPRNLDELISMMDMHEPTGNSVSFLSSPCLMDRLRERYGMKPKENKDD